MTDILGPGSNASGVTTSRPADARLMAAIDTWFQDCTSATASDGTVLSASMLNGLLANLRALARGNGSLVAGGPVVAEDNDDTTLLEAVQHLIQRGLMRLATDTGGANALIATMNPAPPELVDGFTVIIRPAALNTGASTLRLAGLTYPIVMAGGGPLRGGELAPPNLAVLRWNASLLKFQMGGPPPDASLVHYGVDTSSAANTFVANVSPSIPLYTPGSLFAIEPATTNTGAAKANLDAIGLKNIVNNYSGQLLTGNELSNVGNFIALMLYGSDGRLHLLNPLPRGASRIVPFSSNDTFTPQGSLVFVMLWASGEAGRTVGRASYDAGRGGNPGEFRFGFFQVAPGVPIAMTIPAGAPRGSNSNGAAASFGSYMTAMGGTSAGPGTGGFGGFGFTGTPGRAGYTTGNVTNAIIVIGEAGVPFLAGIFGGGGEGGDGGPAPSADPLGRAGQPAFGLVLEMS